MNQPSYCKALNCLAAIPVSGCTFKFASSQTHNLFVTKTPVNTVNTTVKTEPYRSYATTVSQLKLCDFSGETFKDFELLLFFYECNDDLTALQRRDLQTAL